MAVTHTPENPDCHGGCRSDDFCPKGTVENPPLGGRSEVRMDGVITIGFTSIDQHKLTGESQPVEKEVFDSVFASTVVLAGRIGIRTEKTGEETVLTATKEAK